MAKHTWLKCLTALLLAAATLFAFVGCKKDDNPDDKTPTGPVYNNETDPLVFSTLEVDKVFNPFFSTSATDSNIVGMTQISMLSNDKDGNYTYGDSEAVVVKDLQIVTEGTPNVDQTTTYYFVLKNNVKFSDGTPLTMKDVLFNLYVYLDPAYTGSSTIYSTEIVGLKEYRTQTADETEQDSFMQQFDIAAESRIDALVSAATDIFDENKNISLYADTFREKLEEYVTTHGDYYANIVADYDKALEFFREELTNDYSNSLNSYQDIAFSDKEGNVYKPFTTDVEAFLYNEGYITWNKNDKAYTCTFGNEIIKSWTAEQAIDEVFNYNIPDKLEQVVKYWVTATTLHTYLANAAMEEHFAGKTRPYPNISGIRFANRQASVTVNGTEYGIPTYNADGSVASGNEVLSIKIKNVDPKAIWNFAFAVAPMNYYSDAEHIAAFDYEENFGVEYMSQTFMNNTVKNPDKIGVPMGAGPYAASCSSGGITGIKAGDFYSLGVIYFERNPYYLMGPAKIKKIRFQVVSSSQMLNALYNKEIDWAEPNAKPKTIAELEGKKNEGIGHQSITTSGYGYIGINAGKVPDMAVRQAIMHSINTQLCVDYYQNTAQAIYRSMSTASWAYPDGVTAYYPYIGGPVPENLDVVNPAYKAFCIEKGKTAGATFTREEQQEFLRGLVESAGYTVSGTGVYAKGTSILKYTFTVAGEERDHPAWKALFQAGELLNSIDFQITVTPDANALKKLSTGDLAVWAAAWGSTIDPDMYQVYHIDSKASSTLNWGYKQIKNDPTRYAAEYELIVELSELIDHARQTDNQNRRAQYYREALNIVMQLAIELPTYQRKDLFAYNTDKIAVNSLTPESDLSPYKGLTSDLYNVSLVTER